MKKTLPIYLTAICVLFFHLYIYAGVCTTTRNGNWTDGGIWSCGTPPGETDNITINHDVDMNTSVTLKTGGSLTIAAGKSLITSSNKDITIKELASVNISGTLSVRKMTIKDNANFILNGTGTINASGKFEIKDDATVTLNGIINSSDELEIKGNAVVAIGGTLNTSDEFKIKGDAVVTITGTINASEEITFQEDASVTLSGTLTSTNDINIEDNASVNLNGTISITGEFVNSSPSVVLDGTMTTQNFYNESSGVINGSGNLNVPAAFTNDGFISEFINVTLPIELLSFIASLVDKTRVAFEWITATEINNDYFTVERSSNGITFNEILKVKGAGNSTSQMKYTGYDEHPVIGTAYYRLKQTDFDGKFSYHRLIAVNYEKEKDGSCVLKVFPNPCMGKCNVQLDNCPNQQKAEIKVELIDAMGHKVSSTIPYQQSGDSYSFYINNQNNLAPGVYVVRTKSSTKNTAKKVIIKK